MNLKYQNFSEVAVKDDAAMGIIGIAEYFGKVIVEAWMVARSRQGEPMVSSIVGLEDDRFVCGHTLTPRVRSDA